MVKFNWNVKRVLAVLLTMILLCPYFPATIRAAAAGFDEQIEQVEETQQIQEECEDTAEEISDEAKIEDLFEEEIPQESEVSSVEEEPMRGASASATCGCVSVGSNQDAFESGNGTSSHPYEIWTAEQLNHVRAHSGTNTYFVVMDDINLNNFAWTPIGTNKAAFMGILDGNGYEIKNLDVNLSAQDYVGLFGYSSGTIQNLILKDISVTGKNYTGGLTGYTSGTIENCAVVGDSFINGASSIGGFAGQVYAGKVEKCYATGTVTASDSKSGGFVGHFQGGVLEKCYATGNVIPSANQSGGFAGYIQNGVAIRNCFSTGKVAVVGSYYGGFVGNVGGVASKIENCYTTSNHSSGLNGTNMTITNCYFDKNLSSSIKTEGRTTAEMAQTNTYVNWDFVNVWEMDAGTGYPVFRGMPKPSEVTSVVWTEISTPQQLNAIRNNLLGNYKLMANIDLTGINWVPLGTSAKPFMGALDGNGYTIKNLDVNLSAQDYVGLVGSNHGIIKNLTLKDISVTGKDYTGGLVGYSVGAIENCAVIGDSSVVGASRTGGLVGQNNGGRVSGSSAASSVSGIVYVGGFAGYLDAGKVEKCYATGDVTASDSRSGGFVGQFQGGVLEKCYATGNVTPSANQSGGFVGYMQNGVAIRNCFSTGKVSVSNSFYGGFAGSVAGAASKIENCYTTSNHSSGLNGTTMTITNCYFNKDLSSSIKTEGRTTAQMAQTSTYVNWDFVNVWEMDASTGYPVFRGMPKPSEVTSVVYTEISTPQQLNAIRNNLLDNYRLVADIDLTGINWVPLGTSTMPFMGVLDGNGYTIKNLDVNLSAQDYVGLVGSSHGIINDLTLKDISIVGKDYTGGLAGYNAGTVENCSVIGNSSVIGASYTGGLIGYNNSGRVSGSSSASSVSGANTVGGFVGKVYAGKVEKCYSTGNVAATSSNSGGFVGYFQGGTIEKCYATGNVTPSSNISGGFVGYMQNGAAIRNCFSTGNISVSGSYYGGFVGSVGGVASKIENCYTTSNHSSGLNGTNMTITNSYFDKNLSSSNKTEGRTTAQMKQKNTYANWDFNNVWAIDENISYPYFIESTQGDSLMWPSISREITVRFGVVDSAFNAVHDGVDVQGREGDYVYSASNGTVVYVGSDAHYGNVVYVNTKFGGEHIQIRYAHLESNTIEVAVGDKVNMGDVLAEMGTSGDVTVNNTYMTQLLELEILESTDGYSISSNGSNGAKVNPLDYFETVITDGYYMIRPYNTSLSTSIPPSSANAAYLANADISGGQAYLRKIVEECVRETLYQNDVIDISEYLVYDSITGTATVTLNNRINTYNAIDDGVENLNDRIVVDYIDFINYFYRVPSIIPYEEEETRGSSDARSSSSVTRNQKGDEDLSDYVQTIINGKRHDGEGGLSLAWTNAQATVDGNRLIKSITEVRKEIGDVANALRAFDGLDEPYTVAYLINSPTSALGNGHNAVVISKQNGTSLFFSYYPSPEAGWTRIGSVDGTMHFNVLTNAQKNDLIYNANDASAVGHYKDWGDPKGYWLTEEEPYTRSIIIHINNTKGEAMLDIAASKFDDPGRWALTYHQCADMALDILEAKYKGVTITRLDRGIPNNNFVNMSALYP